MFSRFQSFASFACLSITVFGLSSCSPKITHETTITYTTDIQNPAGDIIGSAIITEIGADGVELTIDAKDIPEGAHGMHFHEKADCSSADFKSAGGHINPDGKPHGLSHPEGPDNADMPNGIADENNHLMTTVKNNRVTLHLRDERPALLDEDGSALIIHINPDDGVTQPIGGAGARIACASIHKL